MIVGVQATAAHMSQDFNTHRSLRSRSGLPKTLHTHGRQVIDSVAGASGILGVPKRLVFGRALNETSQTQRVTGRSSEQPSPKVTARMGGFRGIPRATKAYLLYFYRTGEKDDFRTFWRDKGALVRPKTIPVFTPKKRFFRMDGIVI